MPDAAASKELEQIADAAAEVVNCIRVLEKSGSNLVAEVLGGHDFIAYDHYPPDDVYDPQSHAQYYFHAHPPDRGPRSNYGHFHTFLGSAAISDQVSAVSGLPQKAAPAHLIAISMSREGRPVGLFTTNLWVTAEPWCCADDLIGKLDRFVIDLAKPSWPLNRWISAMLVLYRHEISSLIRARDARIAAWQQTHPDTNAVDDRRLEVTSGHPIDLDLKLAEIRTALGL
ncbi:MAG: DUF6969 family protein [Rhizomicrobium sp.]